MAINFSQVTHIEIPKYPYHQIDYIKFNGTDNYMDLDRQVDLPAYDARGTLLEFELDDVSSGYIMGVFKPNTRPTPDRFFYIYLNSGKLYVHWQDFYYNYDYDEYEVTEVQEEMCSVSTNTRYTLTFRSTTSGTRKITVKQGNTTLYNTEDSHNFPYNLTPSFMAKKTIQDGQNTYDGFVKCRLYGFVFDGGSVGSMDYYYPIYNDSTQTLGMYNDTDDIEIPSRYYMQGTTNAQSKGDFVNPQTITLPTVEVKQIQNANNVVLWRDVRLVSITLSGQNTSLPINSQFSFGGTVTATYSDGTTANVTSSTTFSGYDMTTSGTQTITATYTEVGITKTATYSLQVVALSSIALSGQTTSFNVGDTFSFGGTVTATYSDGTTANVTSSTTFSGYDMSTAGTQTVTATYTESGVTQTATYTITVTSATWHTIWSGTKTANVLFDASHAGTAYGTGDIVSTSSLRAGVPTKITFTKDNLASSSKITKRGTSSGSWNVSSPQEFTSAAIGQDLLYMNLVASASSNCKHSLSVYSKTGGKIGIWIGNISGTGSNYPQTTFTLKKIEQYW